MTTTTTTANYDADLARATDLLNYQLLCDDRTFPEGEQEKAVADALNNTWVEGLTVMEWVSLAAARV